MQGFRSSSVRTFDIFYLPILNGERFHDTLIVDDDKLAQRKELQKFDGQVSRCRLYVTI